MAGPAESGRPGQTSSSERRSQASAAGRGKKTMFGEFINRDKGGYFTILMSFFIFIAYGVALIVLQTLSTVQ
jgi:hypothetical protein